MDWILSRWPLLLVGAVALLLGGYQTTIAIRRRRKSYRELLEPDLRARGLEFVSSRTPGLFDVGPFPAIITDGAASGRDLSGPVAHHQYRVVSYRDRAGAGREAWALLRFEYGTLRGIEWKPELPA